MSADDRTAFRVLHDGPAPLLLPNAWDVASALALVADGHPAIGTTSLGVAAAAGIPDTFRAGLGATVALARALARLPVPVTVDLADGFADDPIAVAALVADLPAAGVNLEDSTDGRLVDPGLHAAKVAAVAGSCPGSSSTPGWTRTGWGRTPISRPPSTGPGATWPPAPTASSCPAG
ncbi:isocitrate lyase/phosphoenolpyruvate mutase family protein [Geodermatophilus maliterrae]|uniref:Isocitrate lyase/phosphoenolpyruvate mutase family protein n=1 Tax=Geodermatophilus maliterrae TaxID=3162531 RepID=A0ABV3XJX5_9ACTN